MYEVALLEQKHSAGKVLFVARDVRQTKQEVPKNVCWRF